MDSIILIPAYKPEAQMTDLVAALAQKNLTVVVVDDSASDCAISESIFLRPIPL